LDVKVIKLGTTKAFQYTACDDCTRLRVLRPYRRQDTLTSIGFLTRAPWHSGASGGASSLRSGHSGISRRAAAVRRRA